MIVLLAQIPSPSPGSIEGWIIPAVAIVAIGVLVLTGLNQWRQFFKKDERPRREEEPVTRADLDKHLKESDEAHDRAMKESTDRLKEILVRLEKLEKYATDNVHELRQLYQVTNSTVALVNMKITDVLQAGMVSMGERITKTENALARLGNRVSGLIGETRGLKEELEKGRLDEEIEGETR